jgi:uncharacterized protein
MKKLMSFLVLCFLSVNLTFAQHDSIYSIKLKEMFQASGAEETYTAVIKQMFTMFKQQYSNVNVEIWDEFEKEFMKTSMDDLVLMLVPVYEKYVTLQDLDDIIAFYKTPAGNKYAKNTPLIMQESMQIGQKWGLKLGQDFSRKMQESENL